MGILGAQGRSSSSRRAICRAICVAGTTSVLATAAVNARPQAASPVDLADPRMGTAPLDNQKLIGNAPPPGEPVYSGQTTPAARLPHSSVEVAPINNNIALSYPNGVAVPYYYTNPTMIGFSAGAFLAASLAIGDKASRPDFVAMLYGGLRTPVPADAPPAFIAGTADDEYLPNDAIQLYSAWRQAGVAAELHVYERGGHGFGLKRQGTTSDHWLDALTWWMQARGLMAPGSASKQGEHR